MSEFKTYHPIVNLIYFAFAIGFTCFFMHPVCLAISFACAFLYSVMLKGTKAIKGNLIYMLPILVLTAFINPAFNHQGVTVITYLPSGNPLTLESVLYGFAAASMVVSVICHFSSYNEVMTSDKFIYLFGRIIPSMSLIISMTLRFVPKFSSHLKVVINGQKCMGRDISKGSIVKRAKRGLNILSAMTTWSLENAIETADSMKARGYGHKGRTAFSIYKFDKRDAKATLCILTLGIYTLAGNLKGAMYFRFYPSMKWSEVTPYSISVFIAYLLLLISPVIIELWEVRKWKSSVSKI